MRVHRPTLGRGTRTRGEDGVALILALALIALLGAFATAVLTVGYTSFKTTQTTRGAASQQYAADGGADVAIQALRASNTYCPNTGAGEMTIPTPTINNVTVTATCQTLSGAVSSAVSGATTWPLVITGYKDASGASVSSPSSMFKTVNSSGRGVTTSFAGGPSFNAGGMSFASSTDKFTFAGDYIEYDPYCTTEKGTATTGKPTVTGTWTCANSATYAVPDPNPTVIVPTALAPSPTTLTGCKIYYPGKYTTTNEPTFSASGEYYFASGVYYFENVGAFNMAGHIFGGAPSPGETQKFETINPCATDAQANSYRPGTATGTGVEWVLGGNSYVQLGYDQNTDVELFTRQPANPAAEGTPGISLYAPKAAGTNYLQSTVDALQQTSCGFSCVWAPSGGSDSQMFLHGLAYLPISDLYIWPNVMSGVIPSGNSGVEFANGLVVRTLTVDMKNSPDTGTFAGLATTPPSTRTAVVQVTTTVAGQAPRTVRALVSLGTATGTPATILSWRKT